MLYQCKLCNINTNKITNFTNHCKTMKHIDKEKINVFCFVCDKDYKSRRQYTKHRYNKHKNDVIENVDNINSTVVLIIDDKTNDSDDKKKIIKITKIIKLIGIIKKIIHQQSM